MTRERWQRVAKMATCLLFGLAATSCSAPALHLRSKLPPGSRYVSMGSSFAAGPGVSTPAEGTRDRCGRSSDNYAHQLARKRGLNLVDVSCGGATTTHLLQGWGDLAPQLDALNADTMLVTITVGGNDVGYIGSLMAASCEIPALWQGLAATVCNGLRRNAAPDAARPPAPGEEAWSNLATNLRRIAREVHQRAPKARLIFVDYLTLLPDQQPCSATPLSEAAAAKLRGLAERLATLTATIAEEEGGEVVKASAGSRAHHACAEDPWVTAFTPHAGPNGFAPYHPNLAGMSAIAAMLDDRLEK